MKILIADDEVLVRTSLRTQLQRLEIPPGDITEVENGVALVEEVKKHHYQIVFIDIQMPGLSGLEALEQLQQIADSTTHFYVLTGFSNFEYARQAVRLPVKDYLLKPIGPGQLRDILKDARDQYRKHPTDTLKRVREYYHQILDHSVRQNVSFFLPVLAASDSGSPPEPDSVKQMFHTPPEVILYTSHYEGNLLLLFYCPNASLLSRSVISPSVPEQLTLAIQTCCDGLSLEEYLVQCQKLLDCRVLQGINRCLTMPELLEKDGHALCHNILSLVHSYSVSDVVYLERMVHTVLPQLKLLLPRLSAQQAENLRNYLSYTLSTELSGSPREYATYEKAFLQLEELVLRESRGGDNAVHQVIHYVTNHFNQDMSLKQLAVQYGISPNYLSQQFKETAGQNFLEYVTDLRIRRAKYLLLQSNFSIKQIALDIGYYSESHFIKVFTKRVGQTPATYRKTL